MRGVFMKGEGIFGKFFSKNEECWYSVFRIIIGALFLLHGLSKFGVFGKGAMPVLSLMGAAGIIEITAGILIILGIWTRLVALIGAIEMIIAFAMAHAPKGWNPLANGGEAAILFFVAFLILLVHGSGKYAIEHKIRKKELF